MKISRSQKNALIMGIAFFSCACLLSCATTQNGEAIVPLVVGSVLLGMVIGGVIVSMLNDGSLETNEALISMNIDTYMAKVKETFRNCWNYADANAVSNINNSAPLTNFIIKRAEWQARELYLQQKANGEPFTYKADYVLNSFAVNQYLTAFLQENYVFYQTAFQTLEDDPALMTGDVYGNLEIGTCLYDIGLSHKSAQVIMNDTLNTNLKYAVIPVCTDNSGANRFHITNGQNFTLIAKKDLTSPQTINLKDRNGVIVKTFTITKTTGDKILAGQMFDIQCSDVKANTTYYFDNGDFFYAGYYLRDTSDSNNAHHPNSILGYITNGTGQYCKFASICLASSPTPKFFHKYGSSMVQAETVIHGKYVGNINIALYQGTIKKREIIFEQYKDMSNVNAIWNKTGTIKVQANSYAQTYYNLLVATGDDGHSEPMPDWMFPEIDPDSGYTQKELYAMLLVYRQQLADYYKNNTGIMNPEDAKFSPDSLDLLVRGTLYNKTGAVIMTNVSIWSPFATVANKQISLGINYFNSSITAIKWGESSSIAGYMASNQSAVGMRWYYPEIGSYADIEEIYYKGKPVSSYELKVSTYEVIAPKTDNIPPGGSTPDLSSLSELQQMLLMVGGIGFVVGLVGSMVDTRLKPIFVLALIASTIVLGYVGYEYLKANWHGFWDWLNPLSLWIGDLR